MSKHEIKIGSQVEIVRVPDDWTPKAKVGSLHVVTEIIRNAYNSHLDEIHLGPIWVPASCVRLHPDIDALKDAVVEIARDVFSDTENEIVGRRCYYPLSVYVQLRDRIEALNAATRKTPEQLRKDLDDAADELYHYASQGMVNSETTERFAKAKAAHEEALK